MAGILLVTRMNYGVFINGEMLRRVFRNGAVSVENHRFAMQQNTKETDGYALLCVDFFGSYQ